MTTTLRQIGTKIAVASVVILAAANFTVSLFLYSVWLKGMISLAVLAIVLIIFHTILRKGN
jgi:hypothetical protein